MSTGQQPRRPDVCPLCGHCVTCNGERVVEGTNANAGTWSRCPTCTGQQPAQLLAKHQPCGCIVCTCADDVRCHGCGAWHCGTHPVSEIPNAVYEQPAQPESGEAVPPSRRVTANAYVQGIRHGVDPVTLVREMLDYQLYLQSSLTAAQQRIAALERELESERARGIHTCHDQCQRPLCVAQRRIRELEALNAAAFTRIDELRGALLGAREWLSGWASAEPYITCIDQALKEPS